MVSVFSIVVAFSGSAVVVYFLLVSKKEPVHIVNGPLTYDIY
jgi:hypothetical protein